MTVKSWSSLFGVAIVAAVTACSTSDATDDAEDTTTQAPAAAEPAPPAAAPPAQASNVQLPAGVTPEMVAAGQAQWTGGAICTACHGPDANGTALAPSLRDAEWLNATDGSYEQIVQVINMGVAQPKKFPGVMPARGGAALSDAQVNELAAYIYSISHGG